MSPPVTSTARAADMTDPGLGPNKPAPEQHPPTNTPSRRNWRTIAHIDGKNFNAPLETLPAELRVMVYEDLLPQEKIRLDDPACESSDLHRSPA